MRNIEIKTPLDDRPAAVARLTTLGARHLWTRRQRDTFFRVETGWLKLREPSEGPAELIAYHRPTDDTGPRPSDYDIMVLDDPARWIAFLGRALPIEVVVEKERELHIVETTRIHLDHVDGLGNYLELETVVGNRDLAEAETETRRIIQGLQLDRHRFVAVPYRDLLMT